MEMNQYLTDPELEINGAWIPSAKKDSDFLIARSGNRLFSRELTREIEDNQEILDGKDDAADACSDDIMVRVLAKTILKGWRGNVVFNGEVLSYSKDNAEKLLAMKEFRKWVIKKSEELEHYRVKAVKAQGNV